MTDAITRTVAAPGAVLTYEVCAPETPSSHRPLFVFGSPMGASGFEQLVSHFGDRTVITYDPRGMNRSTRDPDSELTAEVHAEDYHRVIEAAPLGQVDAFGSSGGGMCALPWILAHPGDIRTLICHEPPLVALLEDGWLGGGQVNVQHSPACRPSWRCPGTATCSHGPRAAHHLCLPARCGSDSVLGSTARVAANSPA
jgi:pimeloyl-ACP methyl ester carboxylesterase